MRLEKSYMSFFKYILFFLGFVSMTSCGSSGASGTSTPKDLDFASVTTSEDFSEMVLRSITSYQGKILADQFATDKQVDKADVKRTVDLYAEAIRKGDWIREDGDLKQDGNKFSKSYVWLDKRRRMAMTVNVDFSKRGTNMSLDQVEFDTNLEILKKVTY